MKHDHWKLFSWNLTALDDADIPLPHGLLLRPASKSDEAAVQALVALAFSTDAQWTGSYSRIASALQERLHEAFRSQHNPALVILHGTRIIAAACFSTEAEAENHLYCGPCVLPEYRSRGLGAALLLGSLRTLKDLGIHVARAVVKDNTTASKFVYPKVRSVSEPYEAEPFSAAR